MKMKHVYKGYRLYFKPANQRPWRAEHPDGTWMVAGTYAEICRLVDAKTED